MKAPDVERLFAGQSSPGTSGVLQTRLARGSFGLGGKMQPSAAELTAKQR